MVKQHKVGEGSGIFNIMQKTKDLCKKRLSITSCHALQIETNKHNKMDNNKSLQKVRILALIADSSN